MRPILCPTCNQDMLEPPRRGWWRDCPQCGQAQQFFNAGGGWLLTFLGLALLAAALDWLIDRLPARRR